MRCVRVQMVELFPTRVRGFAAAVVSAVGAALNASVVEAQTVAPSQVTPQQLTPPSVTAQGIGNLGEAAGLEAPAGAEALGLTLGTVTVAGAFADLDTDNRALIAALSGQPTTVAAIYEAARRLEQAYVRAGYVLARVIVPRQRLSDGGPLEIRVIDGFIESVRVEGVPERLRAAVIARTEGLVEHPHLRLAQIERALLIAGDIPGLHLKSALARGMKAGGAVLIVEGEQRLVTGSVTLDNHLPDSLGTWQANSSLAVNSALGYGEQAYITFGEALGAGLDRGFNSPMRLIGGGAIIPLTSNGWILNPEYTSSRTLPHPAPGAPATTGDFTRMAVRSSYPLIRDREQTLTLSGGLESITQTQHAPGFGTDLSRDRYGAFRVALNWQRLTPWAAPMTMQAQLSSGLGGRNGADAAASGIPLTRQAASPDFTKLNLEARLSQPLVDDIRMDLTGKAQTAFGKAMLLSEQFALDGDDAVSSAANGTFNVDSGATLRAEVTRPYALATPLVPVTLSPYVFASGGFGAIAAPTALEQSSITAAALGLGLRSALSFPDGFRSGSFGIEFAHLTSNVPGRRDGQSGRVTASAHF